MIFSDGLSAKKWTDGLSPAALALAKARGIGVRQPDPASHQVSMIESQARATAEAAQFASAKEWDAARAAKMEPYLEQKRAREIRESLAKKRSEAAARKRQAQDAELEESRLARQQAALMELSADTAAAIAGIRAEIAAILGAT